MARSARNAPLLLLAGALVASALLILALTWHFTYLQDTWEFLMNRRAFTPDSFLEPHNEHIVVIPVAIQQLFLHLFGMGSAKPEYVLLTVMLVVSACLVFVYISRRVGPWLGLFATVLVLFLGPAWELLVCRSRSACSARSSSGWRCCWRSNAATAKATFSPAPS